MVAIVVSTLARVVIPGWLPTITAGAATGVRSVVVVVGLPGASWAGWKGACAWSDIPAHRWLGLGWLRCGGG